MRRVRPGKGKDKVIITQTPLRISFAGGGTDLRDFYARESGCVISSAIDKYVFVIVKERFDDMIYVNYSRKEIVDNIGNLQHELVRETMRMTGVSKGIEITTLADIPSEGTGLGSSSSITVGLLHALYAYRGELKPAETLAQEACRIEVDILGKPMGKQDQYIAAYGNMRFITFNSNEKVKVESITLEEEAKRRLDQHLMLFYTGVTRSSSSILSEQKANIDERIDELNQMKSLALKAKECLLNNAFDEFAEILHLGWEYKRQLASGISNAQIDEIYQAARKAGAIGGKICGAGGGGFLLLYCPLAKQEDVRRSLRHLRELPFHLERDGSKVIFNIRK